MINKKKYRNNRDETNQVSIDEISKYKQKNSKLINKIKNINKKISELNELKDFHENQIFSLQENINKIYSSKSWRLIILFKNIRKILPTILNKISTIGLILKIKNYNPNKTIIYIPTVGWDIPLFQRPQHLAINLSKLGFNIIYGTDDTQHDHINNYKMINNKLLITPKWRRTLKIIKNSWVFITSSEMNTDFDSILELKKQGHKIIYDYLDEISYDINGKNTNMILDRHQKILQNPECIEFIVVISQRLYDEVEKYYPKEKILLIPNGVDIDHFSKKRYLPIQKDFIKIIDQKKIIVGYYGAIANWLDYNLINNVCLKKPNYNFIFIGPDYDGSNLKKINLTLPNIFFLGPKNYQILPNYSNYIDVAIIPFKKGNVAKAASPIKFFEYLSMEIPTIVTTDLVECQKFNTGLIAGNTNEFCRALDKAVLLNKDKKYKSKLRQIAINHSWFLNTKLLQKKIYEK